MTPTTYAECRRDWNGKFTFREIDTTWKLKSTLRNGQYAWPGGYPMFFITSDGHPMSFKTVRDNLESILDSIKHKSNDGFQVVGCEINYEDDNLFDDEGVKIEAAYA